MNILSSDDELLWPYCVVCVWTVEAPVLAVLVYWSLVVNCNKRHLKKFWVNFYSCRIFGGETTGVNRLSRKTILRAILSPSKSILLQIATNPYHFGIEHNKSIFWGIFSSKNSLFFSWDNITSCHGHAIMCKCLGNRSIL